MIIKQVIECDKRCQIYVLGLKRTCLGCFGIEEIRDKDNETSLKERGGIEIESTVLPFTITIITIYYSDTINTQNLKKNIFTIITI